MAALAYTFTLSRYLIRVFLMTVFKKILRCAKLHGFLGSVLQ